MSNTEQKESQETSKQVLEALYEIHSMADVLGMIIAENPKVIGPIKSMSNSVSCPFISFIDMIIEKAEFCIKNLEEQGA